MRTFLKWVAYAIGAVAIIIVGGSFFLPGEANVSRSAEIAAPPEKVFAIVSSVRRFQEFSPWAEMDPDAKYTFEGPETGAGQKMSWTSANRNVGSGTQTVTEYIEGRRVAAEMDLSEMGKAVAAWDIEPSGAGTRATWSLKAPLDGIMMKWIGLMFDRWVGADYEKGLAKLKAVAEKA
jgi:carbon monoxide dehydrogenase subunit G